MTRHVVRSPHDGAEVGEVDLFDLGRARGALAAARARHADRDAWLPPHRRAAVLRGAARRVRDDRDAFALRIAREGGKPLVDARVEVDRAAFGLDYLAGEAERLGGEEVPMGALPATVGRLAFTTLEPVGVVLAISAFNHPLNLIVHQVGAAVAAGCPVLAKPALEAPLSCAALVDLLHAEGLPEGWARSIPCDDAVAAELGRQEEVAFLSFVGSARVGWALRSAAAWGTRVALEHGGAAPSIVDDSADLTRAVPWLVKGGMYHAGQVCVSTQRVFALASVADALVAGLTTAIEALRVGDPTDPATEVGPLIRDRDVDRVEAWIEEARAGGARVLTGGTRRGGRYFAPTLVVDAPASCRLMTDEVFGPVLCVTRCATLDDAIAQANATRWSFQASVLTRDLDRALHAARRLDASTVLVDDHTAFRADPMPFGGRGASGLGVGGLHHGVRDLCAPKLIVLRG